MNVQIASDLHLEFLEDRFPGYRIIEPAPAADVLVIAGDIHRGSRAFALFADWPVPVVYVHGNHEAYDEEYFDCVARLNAAAAGSAIRYLEQDETVLSGVRFLGCCLWTDYLLGPGTEGDAMAEAEQTLNDHRRIRVANRYFGAEDALRIHRRSRAWLETRLQEKFAGPTVVVTHHAPHPGSIHARYAGLPVNAAFVSDLTPLMGAADLWIHGHVHDSFDYRVASTRIVANPRGYVRNLRGARTAAELSWENERFDPQMVVTVPTP